MTCRKKMRCLLAALCLAAVVAAGRGAEGENPEGATRLSRGRAASLLTGLFHYDIVPEGDVRNFVSNQQLGGVHIGSATPARVGGMAERAKIFEFSQSLVYEGGFFPREIYQLLGYKDMKTAKIGRLTRQLDKAGGRTPSPWEVAGRVGRSDMTGVSDHWAMAPGEEDEEGVSSPGTLAYLPALAITYAAYPADGEEAAAQLAVLKDDDLRAGPTARAALSLLRQILVSDSRDKDAWLRSAAAASRDADTEYDLRSVRIKDWKYLRGEECAMGRLERPLYLWYKGGSYQEIVAEGRKLLRSRESMAYLAALTAVTYGMESMPDRIVSGGARDRQLVELINDLYDLATSEAVLRVEREAE